MISNFAKFVCLLSTITVLMIVLSLYLLRLELGRYSSQGFASLQRRPHIHNQHHYNALKCNPLLPHVSTKRHRYPADSNDDDDDDDNDASNGVDYPRRVLSFHNRSLDFDCLNSNFNMKTILLWNVADTRGYPLGAKMPFITRQCPVVRCELTRDRRRLAAADLALVDLHADHRDMPPLPPPSAAASATAPRTRWALLLTKPLLASGSASRRALDKLAGRFHFAATYAFDSDFAPFYYSDAGFAWRTDDHDATDHSATSSSANASLSSISRLLRQKSGFAVAFSTECNSKASDNRSSSSSALNYLAEMSKHAAISIYDNAACGAVKCNDNRQPRWSENSNNSTTRTGTSTSANTNSSQANSATATATASATAVHCRRAAVYKRYKFALAFEERACAGYVTDLFFEALRHDVVPVVFDVARAHALYVPRSAYVDALAFATPALLVRHLQTLAADPSRYGAFFAWKRNVQWRPTASGSSGNGGGLFCDMCIQLHLETFFGARRSVISQMRPYDSRDSCVKTPLGDAKR